MSKQEIQDWNSHLNKKLNIACINLCTESEGPHKRMAVWFQGCDIRCKGCCNPKFQEFKISHIMTVQDVLNVALKSRETNSIEGVTFLGGEPTLQENLVYLANALKQNGFGVILFTGKSFESLATALIKNVDLVIDGKFDENQIDDNRNLIGSINQRICHVTERYRNVEEWFYKKRKKRVEINLNAGFFITGDVL